ncbi:P-loop containing nucleoside triphosphate hydrolase protein [Panaeolus papilionaceus]|nr:P-loop containing nucleoside triphosphate hydrolase protein [Panaeolus papilionaceus]
METFVFESLRITGVISVEPATTKVPYNAWRYLVMGPTGAGKSSFIEAVAGQSQKLAISKDQLAGYTQHVIAYQLVNVFYQDQPVYLIDTPGFSDTKISEIEIMQMVRKWLESNGFEWVNRILYLTPITDTRLAGTKRRTIDMLKALLKPSGDLGLIIVVTTMWDTLSNEQAERRAQSHYAQLRDEVFRDFIDTGSQIARFTNTRTSGLEIMDSSPGTIHAFTKTISSTSYYLYQDLHDRITSSLQEKKNIELDLVQPEAQTNSELRFILEKNHSENYKTLTKFITQLINFESLPEGSQVASQRLRKSIAAEVEPLNTRYEEIFLEWAREPDLIEQPALDNPQVLSQPPELPRLPMPDNPSQQIPGKGFIRRIFNISQRR